MLDVFNGVRSCETLDLSIVSFINNNKTSERSDLNYFQNNKMVTKKYTCHILVGARAGCAPPRIRLWNTNRKADGQTNYHT